MNTSPNQLAGKKMLRSATVSLFATGVTMIVGLLLMPMVVQHLGDRLYGAWVLVGTLTGYFGFLDLGLSKAVMRFVSQALGRDDQRQADKWITAALVSFSFLSLLGILLSVVIGMASGSFLAHPDDAEVIPLALLIAGLAFSLALPSRCFAGILVAHVRQDVISFINIMITLVRACAIVSIIYAGGSLVALVLAAALLTIMQGGMVVFAARRVHGATQFRLRALQQEEWRAFLGYAMASFASEIADIFRSNSSPLIIAPFLGLAAVTPFAIAERICKMIGGTCNRALVNLTPVFSQQEGRSGSVGNDDLQRSYFFGYKVSCYLGTFSVGMAILLSGSFIERWMGTEHMKSIPILHIMLLGYFFAIIQIPTICLLFAVSKQKFYAYSNIFQAALSIGLCMALVIPYKLAGVAFGISIAMFVVKLFIQPVGASLTLGMPLLEYHLRHTLPNTAIPILFIVGYSYIARNFCQPTYLMIGAIAATGSLLFLLYILACGFNTNERRILLRLLKPSRQLASTN